MGNRPASRQGSFDFDVPAPAEENGTLKTEQVPWIIVSGDVPYFVTDNGDHWSPLGQNDAVTWPDLAGAFRRKDIVAVELYFEMLSRHGVNCLRVMLEYCHGESRYLERPAGVFQQNMVRFWDDIFPLCEKYCIRILLTPYDTFWMWRRWSHHPYNVNNNGPCAKRSQWLICPATRAAIKNRLYFATERWGASGALFAWDLWNEIRPSHGGNSAEGFSEFINDISVFLRTTELELHGRAHPQTVSVFSPVLQKDLKIAEAVFRHPSLDFATIHLYELNSIDNPKNTIAAAITTGRLTRQVLGEIKDKRPFFDSEHGPIKTFNTSRKSLPADFDDEYFRHMQWAHLASGGTGGGMRWPYRHPHTLTPGMRKAQLSLSGFIRLVAWNSFDRVNINEEIVLSDKGLTAFGCADGRQAIIWLLRKDSIGKNKLLRRNVKAEPVTVFIPLLLPGSYMVTIWDTLMGFVIKSFEHVNGSAFELSLPPVQADIAVALFKGESEILFRS